MADDDYWGQVDKAAPAPVAQPPAAGTQTAPTVTTDPYWDHVDQGAPKTVVQEQPPAGGAFRAGVEHAIRSSAPFKWAYEHFPALKQSDAQTGYTPLSDDEYNKRYGGNFYANVGEGTGNLLLMAPAVAATEAVGGPLAAYYGATRLVPGATQVVRNADFFRPAVEATQFTLRNAQPWVAAGIRAGTNALEGLEGAAITGGNMLYGALGGAAVPPALKGVGRAIDSTAGYLTSNPYAQTVANAILRLGGGVAGFAHGGLSTVEGLLETALGAGAGHTLGELVRLGVPVGKAIESLAATSAGPAGATAGSLPIPSPM